MKNILGRKQSVKNEDWLKAVEDIENLISKEELDEMVNAAVEDIRQETAGNKVAYAWSGGKDSLVLAEICRMAGVTDCMLAVCDLEYPAFMNWIEANKPDGLEIINTGQNLEWIGKHPEMLFPRDSQTAARWFSIVQHRAQAKYYKAHDLDMILLGRRRADGNYCGRGSNIYTDGKGVTRYSPLAAWKHEAVLGFTHYYRVPVPPIYSWLNGYLCGTHPWPARQWTGNHENAWKEIYSIDPGIVKEAAGSIESASRYLEALENK